MTREGILSVIENTHKITAIKSRTIQAWERVIEQWYVDDDRPGPKPHLAELRDWTKQHLAELRLEQGEWLLEAGRIEAIWRIKLRELEGQPWANGWRNPEPTPYISLEQQTSESPTARRIESANGHDKCFTTR